MYVYKRKREYKGKERARESKRQRESGKECVGVCESERDRDLFAAAAALPSATAQRTLKQESMYIYKRE